MFPKRTKIRQTTDNTHKKGKLPKYNKTITKIFVYKSINEHPIKTISQNKNMKVFKKINFPKKVKPKLEDGSKNSRFASHGDFRQYLYEAPIFPMPSTYPIP